MSATTTHERYAADRLFRAIETLNRLGYDCWLLEEFAVEKMHVVLQGIPAELPLLPGEVELLVSIRDEILALAEWVDDEVACLPRGAR